MDYFHAITGPKKKVGLIHGDETRLEAMREALRKEHKGEVEIGVLGKTVEF